MEISALTLNVGRVLKDGSLGKVRLCLHKVGFEPLLLKYVRMMP